MGSLMWWFTAFHASLIDSCLLLTSDTISCAFSCKQTASLFTAVWLGTLVLFLSVRYCSDSIVMNPKTLLKEVPQSKRRIKWKAKKAWQYSIIDQFGLCHDPFAVTHRNFISAKIGYILIENIFQVPLVNPLTDLHFHLETGVQWLQFLSGHHVLQKLELQWLPWDWDFWGLTEWQVADQSRGVGAQSSRPLDKGRGWSPKRFFFWSKNKGGGPPLL